MQLNFSPKMPQSFLDVQSNAVLRGQDGGFGLGYCHVQLKDQGVVQLAVSLHHLPSQLSFMLVGPCKADIIHMK